MQGKNIYMFTFIWNMNDVLRSTLKITMIYRIGNHKLPYSYISLLYDCGIFEYLHIANRSVCTVCWDVFVSAQEFMVLLNNYEEEKEKNELCVTYA